MLQNIDKALRGWVTKVIVALITLSFVLWGVQVWFDRGGQTVVAKVGKYNISMQELSERTRSLRSEFGNSDFGWRRNISEFAFLELVQEKFLKNLLDQTKSWLTIKDLALLKLLPADKKIGWVESLDAMPDDQRKANFASLINFSQMISGSGFDLPSEIQRLRRSLGQQRDFDLVVLRVEDFAHPEQVEATKIAEYYQEHRQELVLPAEVRLKKLILNRQFWRGQVANDPELQAEYEAELDRVQAGYARNSGASHLGEMVARAEAGAIRRLADRISRELKYNAAHYQEIAESYGLQWHDLPVIKEDDLTAIVNKAAFDPHLFFRANGSGGWVITAPVAWNDRRQLVTKEDLLGGGVVILWPAETHVGELATLEQAAPTIANRLARVQAEVKMRDLAGKIAEQWRHGALSETLLKQFKIQIKRVKRADFAESYKPGVELAFQKCSMINDEARVATRCDDEHCWVVRLDKIVNADGMAENRMEIDDSGWHDLERQALSVQRDKKRGVRLQIRDNGYQGVVE